MNPASVLLFADSTSTGGGGGGGSVEPLHVDGLHFKRPNGTIWKYRAVTAFSAFHDWLHGDIDKLEAYADWSVSMGFNCWRVFTVWNNLQLKMGTATGDSQAYYRSLMQFLGWLMGRGLYCHLVGLCDQVSGSSVHANKDEQVAHLLNCIGMADEVGNVIFETFNEFEKNDGDDVCGLLPNAAYGNIPSTRSWWNENESYLTAGPLIDFTTGHTDRDQQWARRFIQNMDVMERGYGLPNGDSVPATGRPHILGEPRRIAEGSTPRQHADYHAGGILFGPGGCLHGGFKTIDPRTESDLQFCKVPDGASLECAQAVRDVHASSLWPLDCSGYIRGAVDSRNNDVDQGCPILHRDRYFGGSPDLGAYEEPTGAARTYFREKDGTYYGLAVDPGPQWTLQVRSGWQLVGQAGYDDGQHGGNMLALRRI